MLWFMHTYILIALLCYTVNALKKCETFTIDIDGFGGRREGGTNMEKCTLLQHFANKCEYVSVDIVLDEYISKLYYTNYGTYFNTIQTNITFYDEASSSAVTGSKPGDSKVPIIIAGVFAGLLCSGGIAYFVTHMIKTMMQSGTYLFPDPS